MLLWFAAVQGAVAGQPLAAQPPAAQPPAATPPSLDLFVCPGDPRCPPPRPDTAERPDYSSTPSYGTIALRAGFLPDPRVVRVVAGGPLDAAQLGGDCRGFIARAPDIRLNYSAGTTPLYISTGGPGVTLVVNAPDGNWNCAAGGDSRAMLTFSPAASGQYDIWVGTPTRDARTETEVRISEAAPAPPGPCD